MSKFPNINYTINRDTSSRCSSFLIFYCVAQLHGKAFEWNFIFFSSFFFSPSPYYKSKCLFIKLNIFYRCEKDIASKQNANCSTDRRMNMNELTFDEMALRKGTIAPLKNILPLKNIICQHHWLLYHHHHRHRCRRRRRRHCRRHQSLHTIPLTYLSFETALITYFIVSVIAIVVFVYFLFYSQYKMCV